MSRRTDVKRDTNCLEPLTPTIKVPLLRASTMSLRIQKLDDYDIVIIQNFNV